MIKELIANIQQSTGERLVFPFGLGLRLGDVVEVSKDGEFSLQGNCWSLLGVPRGEDREGTTIDIMAQSEGDVSCSFRAAGTASTVFPDMPNTNAGVEISFGGSGGWILAATGVKNAPLEDLHRFRAVILRAYANNVWDPSWALVTSVSKVDRMTLLASTSKNTKLALSVSGDVSTASPLKAQLTAGASIVRQSSRVLHFITSEPAAGFCRALRVRGRWFQDPEVGDLEAFVSSGIEPEGAVGASDGKNWENVDAV